MTNDAQGAHTEPTDHGGDHGPMPKFLLLVYTVIVLSFLFYLVRYFLMENTHPLYNF